MVLAMRAAAFASRSCTKHLWNSSRHGSTQFGRGCLRRSTATEGTWASVWGTTPAWRLAPSATILPRRRTKATLASSYDDGDTHPLDPLTEEEISDAAAAVRALLDTQDLRFVAVSLLEPTTRGDDTTTTRAAEVLVHDPTTGRATELEVSLNNGSTEVTKRVDLPSGVQPMFTPDDCDLAEAIVRASPMVQEALKERYGMTEADVESALVCDPWSVHLADAADEAMTVDPDTGRPRRLIQTFLYRRYSYDGGDVSTDNQYAHPIDLVPVCDLNTGTVVRIDGLDRTPAPKIPDVSINYHRDLVKTNSYLESSWRSDRLAALNVIQPEGPSFRVDGNAVEWQKWSFRVGFNYREGLVLHDLRYGGRPVLNRASLVEMAVPYADPRPPFQRKCAFDVGDYGLGYCADSLELGCDCLGHIHYFDAVLNDSEGNPVRKPKAVCMHEEDRGVLWKHVEYRTGYNESRRARELVISSIATVVNYEYLFYWKLRMDGTVEFEIKLSGELSTNLPSADEMVNGSAKPTHGVMVAPGINSQIHQHMFCVRLDMAVDGLKNTVSEIDVVPEGDGGTYGNAMVPVVTDLKTESEGVRTYDNRVARSWKISNAEGKVNPITGKPTSYKLLPFSIGPAQPNLLTSKDCAVTKKGEFATANLWVTPYDRTERYPAGEYPTQGDGSNGVQDWVKQDRSIEGEDIILWHSFGVTHIPRVEDFPVMPCESTGFMLKPDGFFSGNPAIDVEPEVNEASTLAKSCCASS